MSILAMTGRFVGCSTRAFMCFDLRGVLNGCSREDAKAMEITVDAYRTCSIFTFASWRASTLLLTTDL